MEIPKIVEELLANKAEKNNKIDLDVYTNGLLDMYQALQLCQPVVSKRKFNLNELRHIAVNYAISCEKGYKGDFDSWFNAISSEWRKIANRK